MLMMLLLGAKVMWLKVFFIANQSIPIISDVNECLVNNGNCSDICVNDIPYHHCECYDGDELDPTGFDLHP